jgi:ATP-dependent Clp protease ATP-binding subunit ClpA
MTVSVMILNRLSTRRIAATASSRHLINESRHLHSNRHLSQVAIARTNINIARHLGSQLESKPLFPATFLPIISQRFYANGRPHPPGGTHRMDLGGGGEDKPALEKYGVDLTARARAGKLDPVIGRWVDVFKIIKKELILFYTYTYTSFFYVGTQKYNVRSKFYHEGQKTILS